MRRIILLLLLPIQLVALTTKGTTLTWNGGGSPDGNSWFQANNWYSGSFPSSAAPTKADDVIIPNFSAIVITGSAECRSITFDYSLNASSFSISGPYRVISFGSSTSSLSVYKDMINTFPNPEPISFTPYGKVYFVSDGSVSGSSTGSIRGELRLGTTIINKTTSLTIEAASSSPSLAAGVVTINGKLLVGSSVASTLYVVAGSGGSASGELILNSSDQNYDYVNDTYLPTFMNGYIDGSGLGSISGDVTVREHFITQQSNTDTWNYNQGQRHHYLSSPIDDSKFYTQIDGQSGYYPSTYTNYTRAQYIDILDRESSWLSTRSLSSFTESNGHPMYNTTYSFPQSLAIDGYAYTGHETTSETCYPRKHYPVDISNYTQYLAYFNACRNKLIQQTPVFRKYDETLNGGSYDVSENYGYVGVYYDPGSPSSGDNFGKLTGIYTNFKPASNGDDPANLYNSAYGYTDDEIYVDLYIPPCNACYNYIQFKGTVNNGTITQTFSKQSASKSWDGLHIAGNPYPSPIDLQEVYSSNSSYFSSVFRVWEGISGGVNGLDDNGDPASADRGRWLTYDASNMGVKDFDGVIGIGQAFYIQTLANGNTLTLTNSHRVASTNYGAFRKAEAPDNLTLEVTGPNNKDLLHVRFRSGGLEAPQNVTKFSPHQANVLYLVEGKNPLYVQHVEYPKASTSLPVGIRVESAGSYTFHPGSLTLDNVNYRASFVDKETHKSVALTPLSSYTVKLEPGEYKDRFEIRIERAGVAEVTKASKLSASGQGGLVHVMADGKVSGLQDITVFDLAGKIVFSTNARFEDGKAAIPATMARGLYSIQVRLPEGVKTATFLNEE